MAKRFIDTNYFNDPFILALKPDDKLLYIYLWTICDHAGIFEMNELEGNFKLSCKNYIKRISNFISNYPDKLIQLTKTHYVLMNFCKRQYPGGADSNVRQVKGAVNILNNWGIEIINSQTFTLRVNKPYEALRSLNKDYGNGNGNGNGKNTIKLSSSNTGNHLFSNSEFCDNIPLIKEKIGSKYLDYNITYYHETMKNWSSSKGIMRKDWIAQLRNFILKDISNGNPRMNKNAR